MERQLLFLHGRSQQHKESKGLKQQWVQAWEEGLKAAGLSMPIAETAIHFPYYGDTLDALVKGVDPEHAAEVIIRGEDLGIEEKEFINSYARILQERFLTNAQIAEVTTPDVIERGPLQWEWVQVVLAGIDRFVPQASGVTIALATHDVYQYLNDKAVRTVIDDGVIAGFTPNVETVVVAHSLGTIIAYRLLRLVGQELQWVVPKFVTLGAPLGVLEIRKSLKQWATLRCPPCVGSWFNAYDKRDLVALYPLSPQHFPLNPQIPAIDDYDKVSNPHEDGHGIVGYLSNPVVARQIYDALVS
jgi:hypothetical protein